MKKLLDRILPWRRPAPSPRARAMMLGAGAGSSMGTEKDGKVHVAVEEVTDDKDKRNG